MMNSIKKINTVIFDLDDTLYDCSGTLVLQGRRKTAKTIARIMNCTEEEAFQLQLETEKKYGKKENIYEKIVSYYKLPKTYIHKLTEEFIHVKISHIVPFEGTKTTLLHLKKSCYRLFLVTSGERQIQEKKIKVLGLNKNFFDEIVITGQDNGNGKKEAFKRIMQRYKLMPEELICVGDKIDDELSAGRSLGITTVMFEHGRHYLSYREAKEEYFKPDYTIQCMKDLLPILFPISKYDTH